MTEEQQALVTYLEQMKRMRSTMGVANEFVYKGQEHFLLEHGQWYEIQPWSDQFDQGAPKQCFANALFLATMNPELRYVEGFACTGTLSGFPFEHGWNIDQSGKVIDCTWCNTGSLYFGVEFSAGRADDAIWNGDSRVLDDYRRGHPLFRQPWLGEDYTLEWEESEGMRLAQRVLGLK